MCHTQNWQWCTYGILVKYQQKQSPSSLNMYDVWIHTNGCVTFKAAEYCLCLLKVKQDKYVLFCLTKCHAGYIAIDLLCSAGLYGKNKDLIQEQAATIWLNQPRSQIIKLLALKVMREGRLVKFLHTGFIISFILKTGNYKHPLWRDDHGSVASPKPLKQPLMSVWLNNLI